MIISYCYNHLHIGHCWLIYNGPSVWVFEVKLTYTMSVHHFQIRSLHFYLQQVQQHGSSRMGLGWQSSHEKDTSIIQVKIFFTFLWDVQDSSKTKTKNGWPVTLPNYWNVGLQWWSLHDGPRKQAAALTSKPQSSVYAGLVWSSTNLNFRWNDFSSSYFSLAGYWWQSFSAK